MYKHNLATGNQTKKGRFMLNRPLNSYLYKFSGAHRDNIASTLSSYQRASTTNRTTLKVRMPSSHTGAYQT